MSDLSTRIRRRLGALARRLGLRDAGADDAPASPPPAPWPVPQLDGVPAAAVLRVAAAGVQLAAGELRAHPNRLAGGADRLVVDVSAFLGPGVWAGAFASGGTATGAALVRLADEVGRVEVTWDVDPAEVRAAGLDVDAVTGLDTRSGSSP